MQNPSSSRRQFLGQSVLAGIAALGIPEILRAVNPERPRPLSLPEGATILFQGDSITDAGRDRARYYPNDARGMGVGYVHQIVTSLLGKHPDKQLECYNRGISGNKVFQLADRWEDDCLHLSPDVLSILIGVNDFWHTLSYNYDGTVEIYERDLRRLLDRTKASLPNVQLVIGEPFAVQGGSAITGEWFPEFNGYRQAAEAIATDYQAIFIPYQSIFDKALDVAPVSYWCPDGVHPSLAGAYLMAEAWMEAVEE
jgi:lysophospholipase L1-like esterase